jgi:hypothetical protein
VTVDGRRVHEFMCTASNCKGCGKDPRIIRRYLDKSDQNLMGNLRKHARFCWGEEILQGADGCRDLDSAQEGLERAKKRKDGSITTAHLIEMERERLAILIVSMIKPKLGSW